MPLLVISFLITTGIWAADPPVGQMADEEEEEDPECGQEEEEGPDGGGGQGLQDEDALGGQVPIGALGGYRGVTV